MSKQFFLVNKFKLFNETVEFSLILKVLKNKQCPLYLLFCLLFGTFYSPGFFLAFHHIFRVKIPEK